MTIVRQAEVFVRQMFKQIPHPTLLYHNLQHTEEVVALSEKIAQYEQRSEKELEFLKIAAWFHDVGYLENHENHEARSAEKVSVFLKNKLKEKEVQQIINCILATKLSTVPTTELEAILKDADLAYGAVYHFDTSQIRKEWELNQHRVYTDEAWRQIQLDFLKKIRFYSDYGKLHFGKKVEEQLKIFK